jgi:hypothetical protein
MTLGRRAAAFLAGAAIVALGARRGSAQAISVNIVAVADSISPAPVIVVNASAVAPGGQQATVTLELSAEGQFRSPFLVRSAIGNSASFLVDRLLPERTRIFFRARLLDATGNVIAESVVSHPVRTWLRLVEPIRATNDVLFTDQPRFVWSSPAITLPPGPWQYVITVTNTATGVPAFALTVNDTVFVPSPLDACTSYRWSVRAIAVNGDASEQVEAISPGTFVIQTAACPTATIFYQNFPNPFGRGERQAVTCFWFDLARTASVKLTVYDLRLREVKHIVPGPLGSTLPAGPYGRQNDVSQSGCDSRLSWDGRDDAGRMVPSGVYVAVFDADGVHTVKKILFKGQ